jgi:hypothetical protein
LGQGVARLRPLDEHPVPWEPAWCDDSKRLEGGRAADLAVILFVLRVA